jgi:hypothetical protein
LVGCDPFPNEGATATGLRVATLTDGVAEAEFGRWSPQEMTSALAMEIRAPEIPEDLNNAM